MLLFVWMQNMSKYEQQRYKNYRKQSKKLEALGLSHIMFSVVFVIICLPPVMSLF